MNIRDEDEEMQKNEKEKKLRKKVGHIVEVEVEDGGGEE